MQHVETVHPLEAGKHVGGDEAERMAHVQTDAARIREHVEDEQARASGDVPRVVGEQTGAVGRVEDVVFVPTVLPLVLDLVGEGGRVALWQFVVGHTRRGYRPRVAGPGWYLG